MKVLLVDDSLIVRSGLEAALKENTLWDQIELATNGREGLEKIESWGPDIVLSDVEMPEMDGIELLKEVGKRKKEGRIAKNLPVIILSAIMYENDANVRKAKMLGAAAVLSKPEGKSATLKIDAREVQEAMKEALRLG